MPDNEPFLVTDVVYDFVDADNLRLHSVRFDQWFFVPAVGDNVQAVMPDDGPKLEGVVTSRHVCVNPRLRFAVYVEVKICEGMADRARQYLSARREVIDGPQEAVPG